MLKTQKDTVRNVEKEEIRNDIETEHKDSKSNTSVET